VTLLDAQKLDAYRLAVEFQAVGLYPLTLAR